VQNVRRGPVLRKWRYFPPSDEVNFGGKRHHRNGLCMFHDPGSGNLRAGDARSRFDVAPNHQVILGRVLV
jgi:hypothetical protein